MAGSHKSKSSKNTQKAPVPIVKKDNLLMQTVLADINYSCKALSVRGHGKSILHDHSFKGLNEYSHQDLWSELLDKNELVVDLFNAISNQKVEARNTPEAIQQKYTLVYSILMNIRWHELSLLQRINSVLLIEGGCSQEV